MWNFLKDQLYYDSYKSSTHFNINIYHIPRYSLNIYHIPRYSLNIYHIPRHSLKKT